MTDSDAGKLARVEELTPEFGVRVGGRFYPRESRATAEIMAREINDAAEAWAEKRVKEAVDLATKKAMSGFKSELRAIHAPTVECAYQECPVCAFIDCPFSDPLHCHHDGCPSEYVTDMEEIKRAVEAFKEMAAKMADDYAEHNKRGLEKSNGYREEQFWREGVRGGEGIADAIRSMSMPLK